MKVFLIFLTIGIAFISFPIFIVFGGFTGFGIWLIAILLTSNLLKNNVIEIKKNKKDKKDKKKKSINKEFNKKSKNNQWS